MDTRILFVALSLLAAASAGAQPRGAPAPASGGWQQEFNLSACNLLTKGRNEYFVLEPGFRLEFQDGGDKLHITVLNETKMVAGVETRVVEEREWKDGELTEVSRNYFAICEQTKDVFYFGEDVDNYKKGKVDNHNGTWLAGQSGNRPGLIMPGNPKPGMRYYQEIAPGVAMDRAEVISVNETCKTPAGTFKRCLKVKETSAIELLASEYKYHAPGIGLVRDEDLRLVKYGFINH